MRKALFATVVAGGIAPLLAVGCTSRTGPTLANNNASTDWFGAKKLAALFKPDVKISATETASPQDPTSLAHKGKPPGADLYVATARLYEKQNNFAAAEEQYQHALKATPTDLTALLGYGHLLDRQNKLDQATGYYQQAVMHHPQDATAHNDLGLCYARRAMLNESLVELSKAVELAPEKKLYRNNIATVLVEMNQPERALEHLTVGEQPAVAHYNLACLLHQRGQSQAAASHFAQAAQQDPSMTAAQQWSEKLGAGTSGPRMTNVRPVEQSPSFRPNTQWSQPASAQLAEGPALGGGGASDAVRDAARRDVASNGASGRTGAMIGPASGSSGTGWPQTGADRNWAAYDVSAPSGAGSSPMGGASGASSGPSLGTSASAMRGSAYAAIPPTPETAGNYSVPASTVDMLPPVEQTLPRY